MSRRPPPQDLGIRRAGPADAAAFAQLMSDPRVYATVLDMPHPTSEQWHGTLARVVPGEHFLCAVRQGRLLGWGALQVHPEARRRHSAVIGVAVGAEHWGQGVGTVLLEELLALADLWLDLRRVELVVSAQNTRARQLYESFGFELEGVQRQWAYQGGRYVDACLMSRLRAPAEANAAPTG
jgi:L-phenylalanine/L-methionine N-acetyltransferase